MSTLGFAGMDSRTHTMLHEAFSALAERLQLDLQLRPDADADFVVVDMDSLYGPLSWLQLYNAGATVIGYTSAARSQTHFHLPRDFDDTVLQRLFDELAILPKPGCTTDPPSFPRPAPIAPPPTQTEAANNHLPQRTDDMTPTEAPAQSGTSVATCPQMLLGDWLSSGQLHGLLSLQPQSPSHLVIDMDSAHYYGPRTLKPLQPLFEIPLQRQDFEPVPGNMDLNAIGHEQPLTRLVWFAALLRGGGRLLPQHDPNARYRLSKWMQTEREYPKHFRIASALMKGDATIPEISEAATASEADVADFLNACLAIGTVDLAPPEPIKPQTPPRSNGLFGKLKLR